ncbi:alpha/beta-hydrolase [Microthyrium microscopicum]|uniref:Alpha/beta-hydrolase n=1 Tax=Microthyrium microscopicum TaxID=703497 RepID=A0A6A6UQB3_9PEZI|nr:alpha/beta-hydrolase [Microthyrium microscopicum]
MRFYSTVAIGLSSAVSVVSAQDGCSALHLIFARGTGETKGLGLAGTSLATELKKLVPGVTTSPDDYPADFTGCASESKGIDDLVKQLTTRSKACPKQKYALGGHSQGAVVTTRAIPKMPKDILPRILTVTNFGSPPCLPEVKDRCKSYCNKGDDICDGSKNSKSLGRCVTSRRLMARSWMTGEGDDEFVRQLNMESAKSLNLTSESTEDVNVEQVTCTGADTPEKGHPVSGFTKFYHADAFYTKAAACYIATKFQASS